MTQITQMAALMFKDMEWINPLAEPPWQRTWFDDDLKNRITIHVPPNKPGGSFKMEWAATHCNFIHSIEQSTDHLLVYTDGSLTVDHGVQCAGFGAITYYQDHIVHETFRALGQKVEVYDAKMEALAVAVEHLCLSMPNSARYKEAKQINFYVDNMGAIYRIFDGSPGKAQGCSCRFCSSMLELFDWNPELKILIEWAPGHHDIISNEHADCQAKDGVHQVPANPDYTSLSHARSICRKQLLEHWRITWATSENHHNLFTPTNTMPPSLQPSQHFLQLGRRLFSHTFQCRTGHAHIGECYTRQVPTEPINCPCRAVLQTQLHILQECEIHDWHQHLLGASPNQEINKLLGTQDGILHLAKFLDASHAMDKH
jgi:ribonuclease HI